MTSNYNDELRWAYHGEVYGEVWFATMAESVQDPKLAAQLGLVALIERQTKEQLAPLCDREGVKRNEAAAEAKGRAQAERASDPNWEWNRFFRSFAPATDDALKRYRYMRDELAPESDARPMQALVAHEELLQSFVDGILANDNPDAESVQSFVAALQGHHRVAGDHLMASIA